MVGPELSRKQDPIEKIHYKDFC